MSLTYTSSCHHPEMSTNMARTHALSHGSHARSFTRLVRWYLDMHIVMLSSSCEFYRQNVMRPSTCELDGQFVMLSSSCDSKFMLPKRRFWKDEQKMKCGFSMEFSTIRSPNRVLTSLKSASNIRILSCVHPSKIFVWEG